MKMESTNGRPERIALLTRYLTMGGIQRIMIRLANGFAARGYQVDLVVVKGEGSMAVDVSDDVRIVNLNSNRVWTALPAFLKYLGENRPSVVLSGETTSNLLATWSKQLSGSDARFVLSMHQNTSKHAETDSMWYARFLPGMITAFYPLADRIVTVSTGIRNDLESFSVRAGARSEVIYNPVVDEDITEKARENVDHPWLTDDDVEVVLGVGRLVAQKNFDLLVRAFARVREERNVRLILLSQGKLEDELRATIAGLGIEQDVDIHGFVSNPYAFMARADVFVLSSIFEGLPTVLIEALGCGCPVVSTDCPDGPSEILEDGRWGRLVDVGDEKGLAEAILETLKNPPDPDRLRLRAATFSVNNSVDAYLKTLFPTTESAVIEV